LVMFKPEPKFQQTGAGVARKSIVFGCVILVRIFNALDPGPLCDG
jgi:hypothetical protein